MISGQAAERAAALEPIRPQPGGQLRFLSTSADIAIGGGSAGGSKTYSLLLESLRHIENPRFRNVLFRSSYKKITAPGALWDTASEIYPRFGAEERKSDMEWRWPSGAVTFMRYLESNKHARDWQGSQVPLFEFDELTEISEWSFFFITSRLRSMSGVRPYVRATCNPDPDSWVADFISWWIDQQEKLPDGEPNPRWGYYIPERAGVLRWMLRAADKIHWFDSKKEAERARPDLNLPHEAEPKSVTFIPMRVEENKALLDRDPSYLGWLHGLPLVERERLLKGNWKIRPTAGMIFDKTNFKIVQAAPAGAHARVRSWDKAGSEGAGKWTAGVLMARTKEGRYVVEDVVRGRWSALKREQAIKQAADLDAQKYGFGAVVIWLEQEPGSGGKESAEASVRNLAGHLVSTERPTGSKVVRAGPYSAQVENGNVDIVAGDWNKEFLDEHQAFDERADSGSIVCDQVDAAAQAFNKLAKPGLDYDALNAE